ncbi:serine hydrolase domain-containing protein [Nonomuraea sp. NPDC050536]|uniref:serine hydrolase domain-containing protein n=1 Tax=Nonomuraea sp. NPDC050536 TaxID=3364366 RepID=UPI0037CBFAD9
MGLTVHGTVAPGYEAVLEEFAAVEPGAQLAAYVGGRQVVDLWAGDGVGGDSLTGLYSSTKAAAYVVVALLVQEGALSLDRAVSGYWPEFAAAGKSAITLRELISHRSGLVNADGGFTVAELADEELVAKRMAEQRPLWRPGSAYGYGGFVIGAMVGEVVRRVTGHSIQQLFEERVRSPYELDLYLGLPEELEPRFLEVLPWIATPEQEATFQAYYPGPDSVAGMGYNLNAMPPFNPLEFANHRVVRAGGPASAGGVGSARGLAGMYQAILDGLLDPYTVAEFATIHSTGGDLVGGPAVSYALGFQAKGLEYRCLSAYAFGHNGSAGSDGFADPRRGIAYGYTRRRAAFGYSAPENQRLAAAIAEAAARA